MKYLLLYIYTIVSYSILYILTFLGSVLVLLLYPFGFRKTIRNLLALWARGTFVILAKRFTIKGKENINKDRNYILMANHSSIFDIMGIMSICPNIAWFGRAHLLKIPVFGKLLQSINYIPMETRDLRNTKLMIEKLVKNTKNQTVAIFPEGTRTVNGELAPFRKGFLHVMKASKLDILPVSLIGFYKFKPKNRFYFNYSEKLSAKVHRPIPYDELKNLTDQEIIERVKTTIESALF